VPSAFIYSPFHHFRHFISKKMKNNVKRAKSVNPNFKYGQKGRVSVSEQLPRKLLAPIAEMEARNTPGSAGHLSESMNFLGLPTAFPFPGDSAMSSPLMVS
jgi:hypothetical protein